MIYRFFRNIFKSYKFPLLVIILILFISERIIDNYNDKQDEKRKESFSGEIMFLNNENANSLIDYKSAYDSLFHLNDNHAIQSLNSKYQSLFEKLRLSENIICTDKYLLIEFETQTETDLALMITKLSPHEIFENLRVFMHYRTLFSEDERVYIYVVKDILN